jgi:hypothetical protein
MAFSWTGHLEKDGQFGNAKADAEANQFKGWSIFVPILVSHDVCSPEPEGG